MIQTERSSTGRVDRKQRGPRGRLAKRKQPRDVHGSRRPGPPGYFLSRSSGLLEALLGPSRGWASAPLAQHLAFGRSWVPLRAMLRASWSSGALVAPLGTLLVAFTAAAAWRSGGAARKRCGVSSKAAPFSRDRFLFSIENRELRVRWVRPASLRGELRIPPLSSYPVPRPPLLSPLGLCLSRVHGTCSARGKLAYGGEGAKVMLAELAQKANVMWLGRRLQIEVKDQPDQAYD